MSTWPRKIYSQCNTNGVLFDKAVTTLLGYPGGLGGSYTVPKTVTSIGDYAFADSALTGVTIPGGVTSIGGSAFNFCAGLINIAIPASVTSIASYAFGNCGNLAGAYFQGNPPGADSTVFTGDNGVVYYLPALAMNWGVMFGGLPTALWNPLAQSAGAGFGPGTNGFGFNITGNSGLMIVVEASPTLANPAWTPLATNTLTGVQARFNDPQSTNSPTRYYRIRSP